MPRFAWGSAGWSTAGTFTDAFIDGRYVASRNDGIGLRGSANQEIWFNVGSRFSAADREQMLGATRNVEVRVEEDRIFTIGIPGGSWPRNARPEQI